MANSTTRCRACLRTTHVKSRVLLKHKVTINGIAMTYAKIIADTSNIPVEKDDGRPQTLCLTCSKRAYTTYRFIRTCQKTDYILRNTIAGQVIKDKENFDDSTVKPSTTAPKTKYEQTIEIGDSDDDFEEDTYNSDADPEYSNDVNDSNDSDSDYIDDIMVIENESADGQQSNSSIEIVKTNNDSQIIIKNPDPEQLNENCKELVVQVFETCDPEFINIKEEVSDVALDQHYDPLDMEVDPQSSKFKLEPLDIEVEEQIVSFPEENDPLKWPPKITELDTDLICNICNKIFSTKSKLLDHQSRKHPTTESTNKTWRNCKACDWSTKDETDFKAHIDVHVRDNPHKVVCRRCAICCSNQTELMTHKKAAHDDKANQKHSCVFCKFSSDLESVIFHKDKEHADRKTHACSTCSSTFFSAYQLRIHRKKDHERDCKDCAKTFTDLDDYERHPCKKSVKQVFRCWQCGDSFAEFSLLEKHKKVHITKITQPTSSTADTKKEHHKKQLKKKCLVRENHNCKLCGMKFDKRFLNTHMKVCKQQFTCEICSKTFGKKSTLREHKLTHSKDTGGHVIEM